MVYEREASVLQRGVASDGQVLKPKDREKLIAPFLPQEPDSTSHSREPSPRITALKPRYRKDGKRMSMRTFIRTQLHVLFYTLIHFTFSVYIRFRRAYHMVFDHIMSILYYHHRTPELIQRDVRGLSRLPEHLSVMLEYRPEERGGGGLEALLRDVCEVAAWSACAGIPMLSIYEPSGILKNYIPTVHRAIEQNFTSYFGAHAAPSLSVRAPHLPTYSPPTTPPSPFESPSSQDETPQRLSILLLSDSDGRATLVDLTKTLAEMAQKQKLRPADISADLVDAELSEGVCDEPDLLILFSDRVTLNGYPPWQVRLTEVFCVTDNDGVNYRVFLRSLQNFAGAQMRFGR